MRSVAAIFTSPVKSLALSRSESVTVGPSGIVEDRRFHLIDVEGRLVTQRQQGRLTLVQAGYTADSERSEERRVGTECRSRVSPSP